jgi:hypothetical protein
MRQASEFGEPGVVSVWMGEPMREPDLDAYLSREFPSDFGFRLDENARAEYAFGARRPLRDVLSSFSMSASFLDQAGEAAARQGFDSAGSAVVCYAFRYDPSSASPGRSRRLAFVGVFSVG